MLQVHAIRLVVSALGAILGSLAAAPAQEAAGPRQPQNLQALLRDLVIPLHTTPGDPGYGVWAAGPSWKASFHDGFVFYPLLGASAPKHLPLALATESVTAGGEPVQTSDPVAAASYTARRYEIRTGNLVEAYDVRAEGVEQTFTLVAAPPRMGDLVVTLRVVSELVAEPKAYAHQALVFTDRDGQPLVRYGEAFAFDARGDRTEVATSFDGERIRLRLDGAWLARAAFPVTIDPLTQRVLFNAGAPAAPVLDTAIATDSAVPSTATIVCWVRQTTATDADAFAIATDPDFTTADVIFSATNLSYSTTEIAASFAAGGVNRWAIAVTMASTGPDVGSVGLYFHDRGDKTVNSGGRFMASGASDFRRRVAVGASVTDDRVLVTYQLDRGVPSTATSAAMGWIVAAGSRTTVKPEFALSEVAGSFDRESPECACARDVSGWVAVWQEKNNSLPGDTWHVMTSRITTAAIKSPTRLSDAGVSATEPAVGGGGGRYLATWRQSTSALGGKLVACRFDWPFVNGSATPMGKRDVAAAATGGLANGAVAFDPITAWHWAITYRKSDLLAGHDLVVARLGATAGVVERQSLFAHATTRADHASLAFAARAPKGSFQVLYATQEALPTQPLVARPLLYGEAATKPYGTACGGGIASDLPLAGLGRCRQTLSGGGASLPALYLLGAAPLAVPLAGLGMPGCSLHVDLAGAIVLVTTTNVLGAAEIVLPLPDAPVFIGDVFTQWIYLKPSANAAGLLATRGLELEVR